MKKLAILGSTGSIGQQTLDVVRSFPDEFRVIGLAGGRNASLLAAQIDEFQPKLAYSALKLSLPHRTTLSSMEEIAIHPEVDIVVIATSGKIGLLPTLAAVKAGKRVALANKEVLVMAGEIIVAQAKQHHATVIPLDSEHSAIWQCLRGEKKAGVARLILTASGGPFYRYTPSQLAKVTAEQALQHPTWKMGKKVTIDSATLLNKGLEIIEAHWFFGIPYEKIDVLIHPQSIIHSLVEFKDGSLKAQMSFPDMRIPIQYALFHPRRSLNPRLPRTALPQIKTLTFEAVDYNRFPCLQLALNAGKMRGTYPAVLCAADEIAVELFLAGQIGFSEISEIIAETISLHHVIPNPTVEQILTADAWARDTARAIANRGSLCYRQ